MILQQDSRLYIMPADGGQAKEMPCNQSEFNSWHSFSPNSRWLAFATKARGPYTQICLSYIDRKGQSYPPVYLEGIMADKRAANLPEFMPGKTENMLRFNGMQDTTKYMANQPNVESYLDSLLKAYEKKQAMMKKQKQNLSQADYYYKQAQILLQYGREEEACEFFHMALEEGCTEAETQIKEHCP